MERKKIMSDNSSYEYYVTLGSFDVLHKGHLELIKKCVSLSKEHKAKSMVFTFKNHPRKVIFKNANVELLMDNKSKIEVLEELGIDRVVLKDFDKNLMKETPEEFIHNLCTDYNIKGIIVGFNYRFGYKNEGDIELLKKLSKKYDYELYVVKPLKVKDEIVSSTRIRHVLKDGKTSEAIELIGRPYTIRGIVESGKQLGRSIGFPTANLKVKEDILIPKKGVYYTNVVYDGKVFKGITSVGTNPTVQGENLTVETYILEFSANIYDKELKLMFLDRIRNEEKFNSLDELKNRLEKDKSYAKGRELYNK